MGETDGMGYRPESRLGGMGPVISFIFAFIGTGLAVLAMILDELTAVYADNSDDKSNAYCGFRSIWDTDTEVYCGYYYSYFCEDADNDWTKSEEDDLCATQGAGIGWIILCILAVLTGLVSLSGSLISSVTDKEKRKCSKFLDFFAAVFAIAAIVAWFAKNPVCWDESADEFDSIRFGEDLRLGASIYCMIFSCVAFIAGGIFGFFDIQ